MGAELVIPGFNQRLRKAYEANVVQKKKWKGKYAASNKEEYFVGENC